jgi:hypothetical protein
MKRAQMQFGETLMVVIVLVVIIMIGLVFYFNVKSASVYDEFAYREDIEGIKLGKQILSLPEIQATDYGQGSGIDKLKLTTLGAMLDHDDGEFDSAAYDYYSTLFGYATITLHLVPLDDSSGDPILLYSDIPVFNDNAGLTVEEPGYDPNEGRIWTTQYLFTTLSDPLTGREEMAYLEVIRYSRRFS